MARPLRRTEHITNDVLHPHSARTIIASAMYSEQPEVGHVEDHHRVARIICGGQTGADRAALDVAIAMGIPHGGFVPARRHAEDGPIAEHYNVSELPGPSYDERS